MNQVCENIIYPNLNDTEFSLCIFHFFSFEKEDIKKIGFEPILSSSGKDPDLSGSST